MDSFQPRPSDDYSIATYCLYCDICGSFKIRELITLSTVIGISIPIIIATIVVVFTNPDLVLWIICLISQWTLFGSIIQDVFFCVELSL